MVLAESVVKLLSGAAVILSLDWAGECVFRLNPVVSGGLSSLLPVGQRFLSPKVIHNMVSCSLLPSELGAGGENKMEVIVLIYPNL